MRTVLLSLAAACVCGCATPKYLVGDTTFGDRSVKYLMIPAGVSDLGSDKNEQLYDFVVRICDLDPQNQETRCKDTTVVQSVRP